MGTSRVTTRRRRRSSRPNRTPPIFPAQRRAARERAAGLGKVSQLASRAGRRKALRRLPRPVVWLLCLAAAAVGSVFIGFAVGLARPRPQIEEQV